MHKPPYPSQLDSRKVDELIKTMCIAWASPLSPHPNYTDNSYNNNVVRAIIEGHSELDVIQNWMEHIQQLKNQDKRKEVGVFSSFK